MTGLAAEHMGIEDRRIIRPGAVADLVLFDPKTVQDRATPTDPQAAAVGIEMVWMNGRVVWHAGHATGEHAGRVIHRDAR